MKHARGFVVTVLLTALVAVFPLGCALHHVSALGYGPLTIGMTVEEGARALGVSLEPTVPPGGDGSDCCFVYPRGRRGALGFMVVGGTIARVDVFESGILTAEGVGVGSTEAQVMSAYGPALEVSGHRYTWESGGHYLIVETRPGHELVFETDGSTVTTYRAGRVPEVEYVEGCS